MYTLPTKCTNMFFKILQRTELMFLQKLFDIITIKSQRKLMILGKPSKFQAPKCDMEQFLDL